MDTFMWNKITASEAKRLLEEGCADYVQIHESAGNDPVEGLDQQSIGNFFGTKREKPVSRSRGRLPVLVTSIARSTS